MTKTFVVGAEYDENEFTEITIKNGETFVLRFLGNKLNNPHLWIRINGETKKFKIFNPKAFVFPEDMIKPGVADLVLSEDFENGEYRVWTIPNIVFVERDNVFSGSDAIKKILDVIPRLDGLEEKFKSFFEGPMTEILEDINWLKKVTGDPLD